jgi:tRNA(fMet)-specific endonuclease VapC
VFALDSNALIHALKGTGRVKERIARVRPSDIAIPAVVAYEIEFGTLKSRDPEKRRRDLRRLLGIITVLPFDDRAADRSARLRYELEASGEKIGPLDTLIAGTVLAHGATLVTRSTKEFSRVSGLHIEDWY